MLPNGGSPQSVREKRSLPPKSGESESCKIGFDGVGWLLCFFRRRHLSVKIITKPKQIEPPIASAMSYGGR